MFELDSELKRERGKILRNLSQYRKFQRYERQSAYGGFLVFVVFVLLTSFGIIESSFFLVSLIPYFLGFLFASVIRKRFSRHHELSEEESVFLDVCSVLEDLGAFIEDGKEPERKRAEKRLDNISKEIENWDIGSLKLCKAVIGSRFEPFKEAFYRKLVGALKQGEKDDLVIAFRVLTTFAKFLVKSEPSIENLNSMVESMNERIIVTIPSRIPTRRKLVLLWKETPLFRYLVAAGIVSVLSGYAIGSIGYYIIGVSVETAYTMAVTVGLAILGVIVTILTYLRKQPHA